MDSPEGLFQFSVDNVRSNDWADGGCEIIIRARYPDRLIRQQKPKSEGGGWREVPAWQTALYFKNPVVLEELKKSAELARQRELEAAAIRNQREAEALEARRQSFIAGLKSKFVGKKFVGVDAQMRGLVLEFEDGEKMDIAITVGGWEFEGWMVVNGISIDTFDKPL